MLSVEPPMSYFSSMASRSSEQLEHLARELANLTREDRAKVLADAARLGASSARRKLPASIITTVPVSPCASLI
jgi:hypothetical protein